MKDITDIDSLKGINFGEKISINNYDIPEAFYFGEGVLQNSKMRTIRKTINPKYGNCIEIMSWWADSQGRFSDPLKSKKRSLGQGVILTEGDDEYYKQNLKILEGFEKQ